MHPWKVARGGCGGLLVQGWEEVWEGFSEEPRRAKGCQTEVRKSKEGGRLDPMARGQQDSKDLERDRI